MSDVKLEDVRAAVQRRIDAINEKAKHYYLWDETQGERAALERVIDLLDGKTKSY